MSQREVPSYGALVGTEESSIDDKGRIILSRKKRERLGEPFACGIGVKGCLVLYPYAEYMALRAALKSDDPLDTALEMLRELMFGEAEDDLSFDAQGRFVIPQRLRRLMNLTGNVLIIGVENKIEIWDEAERAKYLADKRAYVRQRFDEIEENKFRAHGQVLR